jgi:hypothetical protein
VATFVEGKVASSPDAINGGSIASSLDPWGLQSNRDVHSGDYLKDESFVEVSDS